eukprot:352243-Chlamydomonas_euryale.AAC.2
MHKSHTNCATLRGLAACGRAGALRRAMRLCKMLVARLTARRSEAALHRPREVNTGRCAARGRLEPSRAYSCRLGRLWVFVRKPETQLVTEWGLGSTALLQLQPQSVFYILLLVALARQLTTASPHAPRRNALPTTLSADAYMIRLPGPTIVTLTVAALDRAKYPPSSDSYLEAVDVMMKAAGANDWYLFKSLNRQATMKYTSSNDSGDVEVEILFMDLDLELNPWIRENVKAEHVGGREEAGVGMGARGRGGREVAERRMHG